MTLQTKIAQEIARRNLKVPDYCDPQDLLDAAFERQREFITCGDKKIAALCSRRAGKTYGIALKLCYVALAYPRSSSVYIGLTRESVRAIIWKDIFKVIDSQFKLGIIFNESRLELAFPNGSVINLLGMDAHDGLRERLLGRKLKLAVLDESGSFATDVRQLVDDVIMPTLMDDEGQILVIGTPRAQSLFSYFHEVTTTDIGFTRFCWTAADNPYMAAKARADLDQELKIKDISDPLIQRNHFGRWVIDENERVYKMPATYDKANITTWVLSVDLGFSDSTAITLGGWNAYEKILYVADSFKVAGMTLDRVLEKIMELNNIYKPIMVIIDGAKQIIETWKSQYSQINWVAPLKSGLEGQTSNQKYQIIGALNADIANIKIHALNTKQLITEIQNLTWTDASQRMTNPKQEDHCLDSYLYLWRVAKQYNPTQESPRQRTNEDLPLDVEAWIEKQKQDPLYPQYSEEYY